MGDERLLREIEEFFYEKIPITRAMGVRVTKYRWGSTQTRSADRP